MLTIVSEIGLMPVYTIIYPICKGYRFGGKNSGLLGLLNNHNPKFLVAGGRLG